MLGVVRELRLNPKVDQGRSRGFGWEDFEDVGMEEEGLGLAVEGDGGGDVVGGDGGGDVVGGDGGGDGGGDAVANCIGDEVAKSINVTADNVENFIVLFYG